MAVTSYPCRSCGERHVAHPENECAVCYLAARIVSGEPEILGRIPDPTHLDNIVARVLELQKGN